MAVTLECMPTMFDWPAKMEARRVSVSVSAARVNAGDSKRARRKGASRYWSGISAGVSVPPSMARMPAVRLITSERVNGMPGEFMMP